MRLSEPGATLRSESASAASGEMVLCLPLAFRSCLPGGSGAFLCFSRSLGLRTSGFSIVSHFQAARPRSNSMDLLPTDAPVQLSGQFASVTVRALFAVVYVFVCAGAHRGLRLAGEGTLGHMRGGVLRRRSVSNSQCYSAGLARHPPPLSTTTRGYVFSTQ